MTESRQWFGRWTFCCVLAVAFVVTASTARIPSALAGGGPENVILVVNRNSIDSMTIANHFAQLRQIPPGNLITLDWPRSAVEMTDIDTFREKILLPVLTTIDRRRLSSQIDYIVYSADFPWGVRLKPDEADPNAVAEKNDTSEQDAKKQDAAKQQATGEDTASTSGDGKDDDESTPPRPKWPKDYKSVASINSLTYLFQAVLVRSPAYISLGSNWYMRLPVAEQKDLPTLGFRSAMQFGPRGEVVKKEGRRYVLSTMLAVTSGRGNTLPEVLNYLRRSAEADGTHPKGTIYFMKNGDIRSRTRDRHFPEAVELLKELGVRSEILDGKLPKNKDDVQGTVVGTAGFDWKASGSTIRPGAICEHLTSFGGIMRNGAGQTPLSEFLRYGAAGASGTVVEPYAILAKFPHPFVQVHYARGCTLAEAFYQSVYGPFQLLIVGDPLCRPWANIPEVKVDGIKPDAKVQGHLQLTATATVPGGGKIHHFELFVDGMRAALAGPDGKLKFDTARLGDGYHELRVVAVENSAIQSQGRTILAIETANHGRTITASIESQGRTLRAQTSGNNVAGDKPLKITASSPGSLGLVVLAGSRLLGRISGAQGSLEIAPRTLGFGPVQLRVMGLGNGTPLSYTWAKPLVVTIDDPTSE